MTFSGTASELERNIHVTKHLNSVAREITFIFPNCKFCRPQISIISNVDFVIYSDIHEPIELFDKNRFRCRPMLKPLLSEIYDILQNVDCSQEDWKIRVSDYLMRSNPVVPQITNQCQLVPDLCVQEKSQQTTMTYKSADKDAKPKEKISSTTSVLSSTSPHSSLLLTTSSCVTCGGFDHTEPCTEDIDLNKRVEPQSDEPVCVDEEIIWKEIIVYEEAVEEQSEQKEFPDVFGEDEFAMFEQGSTSLSDCIPTGATPPRKEQKVDADLGGGQPDAAPAADEAVDKAAADVEEPPGGEASAAAEEAPQEAAEAPPPAAEEAPPAADEPPPEAEG